MPGPPPKPTALALVEGGGKLKRKAQRERAKHEPRAPIGLREPPAYLSDHQRALWADLVADAPSGLLCRVDTDGLVQFVVVLDAQHTAMRRYNEWGADPLTTEGARAMRTITSLGVLLKSWAADYGFTPAARARLASAGAAMAQPSREPKPPVDPLQRFLGT